MEVKDLLKTKVALAPMAGISNPSYMKIVESMGASYVVTELISAEAIVRDNKKTWDMLNGIEDIKIPVGVQLFGSNGKVMKKAAFKIKERYPNVFIDINMGCPVPKVATRALSGSALLKDLDKVYEVASSVKEVGGIVTCKIRSGWDQSSINAVKVAKTLEKAGIDLICIHPRTRSEGYTGRANWSIIKKVKENVTIPVVGNGDIHTYLDSKRMLEETSCDAVMIGRSALGNPWIILNSVNYLSGKSMKEVTWNDKKEMILKHLEYLKKYQGEKLAVLQIRTHIPGYLKGLKNSSEMKNKLFKTKSIEEIKKILDEVEYA